MRINPTISTEISALNQDKLILERQIGEDDSMFLFVNRKESREGKDLARIRGRLAYLARLVEWYKSQVAHILALVDDHQITIEEDPRFDFQPDRKVYRVSARQLAADILDSMVGPYPMDAIISHWVSRLVGRGLLSSEIAAGLDMTVPVDTERLERRRLAEKKEADFQAGIERLKQAVIDHGRAKGNSWAYEDFRQAYHSKTGGFSHDEKGLLEFSTVLGQRRLLPGISDRALSSVAELWEKLKGVVA